MPSCPKCGSTRVLRGSSSRQSIIGTYHCKSCDASFEKFSRSAFRSLMWRSPGYLVVAVLVAAIVLFVILSTANH